MSRGLGFGSKSIQGRRFNFYRVGKILSFIYTLGPFGSKQGGEQALGWKISPVSPLMLPAESGQQSQCWGGDYTEIFKACTLV